MVKKLVERGELMLLLVFKYKYIIFLVSSFNKFNEYIIEIFVGKV